MYILFLVLSFLAIMAGCVLLTQATLGVGIICLAIWCAIIARLSQAQSHHAALHHEVNEWRRAAQRRHDEAEAKERQAAKAALTSN